jgi:signal transduction histidine kinase
MNRVAAVLAHALGTPLNVISGRAALIARPPKQGGLDAAQNAAVIERQVETLASRIQRALDFLRGDRPPPETCDLDQLVAQAIEFYAPLAAERGVALEHSAAGVSARLIRLPALQALIDLISLGFLIGGERKRIVLRADREKLEPPATERGRVVVGEMARFNVRYEGAELAADLLQNPHEPWEVRGDLEVECALTLAVCFGLAREYSGWIDVERAESSVTLVLCWPVV